MTAATAPLGSADAAERILAAVREAAGPAEGTIPLHEPEFAGREREYVAECIDTGWVSSVGPFVDRIERDLAAITGVERAVAVVNGTAALHMCLLLAGVRPGDEVLLPTLTFIATANAVSYAQATPHFVDSEADTLGIDAAKLNASRSHGWPNTCITISARIGAPLSRLTQVPPRSSAISPR